MNKQEIVEHWSEVVRKIPLICGLKTFNAELTIYACLRQAYKQFDWIVITDDGSTDNTIDMIRKCIKDFNISNITILDVSSIDPWPEQKIEKRDGDHHVIREGDKTHAKAQAKNYQIIKDNFANCLYVSLEDDVILYDNVRMRIFNRAAQWDDPFTDCEFFNVTTAISRTHTIEAIYENQPGVPIPGMRFRRLHDNAGDYTLAAWWAGGDIQVGPDPNYPFGACLFPWLPKNQMGKKGQCNDKPFGFHMVNYRLSKVDYEYGKGNIGIKKFKDLDDPDIDPDLLVKSWFPQIIELDENYVARLIK